MNKTNNGHYRPFPQIKRDCKQCNNLIAIEKNSHGIECIRCKIESNNRYPYIEGIYCARYEGKDAEAAKQ